jgi:hypothetical protein
MRRGRHGRPGPVGARPARPPILGLVPDLTRRFHLPSAMRSSRTRIDPREARELIAGGAFLVDVRRVDDPAPAIDGALRISPDMVPGHLSSFPRDVPIVLGCT